MLERRRRRRANIEQTLGKRIVSVDFTQTLHLQAVKFSPHIKNFLPKFLLTWMKYKQMVAGGIWEIYRPSLRVCVFPFWIYYSTKYHWPDSVLRSLVINGRLSTQLLY